MVVSPENMALLSAQAYRKYNAKDLPKITICNLLKILCTLVSEETEESCTSGCTAFCCCTARRTSPDYSAVAPAEAL